MVTVDFYLDTRSGSAVYPVRLRLTHNRQTAFISTGIVVAPENWDKRTKLIFGTADASLLNASLQLMLNKARLKVMFDDSQGANCSRDIITIRDEMCTYLGMSVLESRPRGRGFVRCMEETLKKKKQSTANMYRNTLSKVERYCREHGKDPESLRFEDITPRWLESFEEWLSVSSPSLNARDIHFRNIRAVFNRAIDDEITTYYPFRKFRHKTEETAYRALSIEEIRVLWNYPCEEWQQRWIDVFKLTFYLRGINLADLFYLTEENYYSGRIVYRRAKTGKLYSVKVEPEAAELIDKYRGKEYLLEWGDTYKHHQSLTHRINLVLKSIGEVERKGLGGKKYRQPLFPRLTLYAARHSVATLMSDLDIPNETIAAALGHSYGNRTTAIYIKPNQNKVDRAMRKLIDYILQVGEFSPAALAQ